MRGGARITTRDSCAAESLVWLRDFSERESDCRTLPKVKPRIATNTTASAKNADSQSDTRVMGVTLLSYLDPPECRRTLEELTRDHDQPIRIAAIKSLLSTPEDKSAADLLKRLRSESPAAKRAILDSLINRPATLTLLLDAIENGDLSTTDID